jgi:hypothetical protein
MVGSSRHQDLPCRQTRDTNGMFSSGAHNTPPPGSPSSSSKSDDESTLEMWYVTLTTMHQHARNNHASHTGVLEEEEDVGSPAPNHVERVIFIMS